MRSLDALHNFGRRCLNTLPRSNSVMKILRNTTLGASLVLTGTSCDRGKLPVAPSVDGVEYEASDPERTQRQIDNANKQLEEHYKKGGTIENFQPQQKE